MSKLALASLCAGLLSCAAQQAEYYIDQLADPRSRVRRDASHALVQLGDATVEPLLNHAATGSDTLRYIAAQILGQIGDRRATLFLKALLRDENLHVREQAVRALGQLDDPHLHAPLASVLSGDPVPEVRGRGQLGAWATSATPRPCPLWYAPWRIPFPRCADKPSPRFSFCGRRRPKQQPLTRSATRDDNVRYVAAQLLGHHRTHRALDALCLALADDNIWVRAESAPHSRPHWRHHGRGPR